VERENRYFSYIFRIELLKDLYLQRDSRTRPGDISK
jgi:hypothetical protein